MSSAVKELVEKHTGKTLGLCSHGNVISLFLNHIQSDFRREHAEQIRNPDVMRVHFDQNGFLWDSKFVLAGLSDIATHYSQMKPN